MNLLVKSIINKLKFVFGFVQVFHHDGVNDSHMYV